MSRNTSYTPQYSEQLSLQGRQQAERKVRAALEQLDPGGEMEGSVLERYYPIWHRVGDIPAETLEHVARDLGQEVCALEKLGEEKYFANLTPVQKLDLHKRALDLVDMTIHSGTVDAERPITFAAFEKIRRACVIAASPWSDGTEPPTFDMPEARQADEPDTALCVIAYLNGKTGRNFGMEYIALRRVITARLEEGCTLEELKRIIDARAADGWDGAHPEKIFGNGDIK